MATVFTLGKGSSLNASLDGGTTNTKVGQLKTISFAGNAANYDDVTNMDSPGLVQEFAPTTISPGTAPYNGVFNDNDAGQVFLAAAHASQAVVTFTLQFAPKPGQTKGFKRVFNAYVMEHNGPDAQYDKSATMSGTLKITGVVTDTAGS